MNPFVADPTLPATPGAEICPVSFGQQRLWFLDQLVAGPEAYHTAMAWWLHGRPDVEALEAALREIQRRHESLRTTFEVVDGEPVQLISPDVDLVLEVVEAAGGDPDARRGAASESVHEHVLERFDLGRGPVVRARLVRVEPELHVLSVVVHHIAADGWSLGVFQRELEAFYEAGVTGHRHDLPQPELQYADFAIWQREWLTGERLERQVSYWREQLRGLEHLALPTDHPRPPFQTYRGEIHSALLPGNESRAVMEFAAASHTTPAMVLQAAFAAVLARYTGQDDVTVGIPIANRNRSEIEGIIGFFVNSLAIRTDLSGDPTFRELLSRVRSTALEAHAHQDLPFEKLVEELQPERDRSRNPIFQVWFAFQNLPLESMRLTGLDVEPFEFGLTPTRFDLELHVWSSDEGYALVFFYNPDLFERATIERLEGHFRRLLRAAVANPAQRVSDLPLLSPEETEQLLDVWNATDVEYPADATLHGLFEAQVARTPDAPAVRFEGERLTYRELDARVDAVAGELRTRGVGRDTPVAVYMERSVEMVVALLAVLKAGGAYLPVDPTNPPRRVAAVLADAAPPVVLVQRELEAALRDAWSLAEAGAPPAVLVLEPSGASAAPAGGEVVREAPAALSPGGPDDLAYVIYTSGSTGRPKGVMVTHRAICNRLFWMQDEYGLDATDRVLQKTPFTFDVSVWEFFWPLVVGAELVVARPGGHKDPRYLVEAIRDAGVTTMHFVPSMLQIFLSETEPAAPLPLRRVFSSGEALSGELAAAFLRRHPGVELHNLYGPTEAAVDVTYHACSLADERPNVPIGRPVANTRLYVLDARMRPVPIGVYGELYLGGVQVARGYLNRPELTAERFVPDPWSDDPAARLYRTGDVVRYLPDGNVEFAGRVDHQVKIRGNRIECGEIEAALHEHAAVEQAVVTAPADAAGEPRLVAYVVPSSAADGSAEGPEGAAADLVPALRLRLAEVLPAYMVPSDFVVLDAFPLTSSGKVDRNALPAPDPALRSVGNAFVEPRSDTERALVGIWRDLLHVERIGVDDSFFDLGGHSLIATRLVSRLRDHFGQTIPLAVVFEHPTVAGLARELDAVAWALAPRGEASSNAVDYEVGEL